MHQYYPTVNASQLQKIKLSAQRVGLDLPQSVCTLLGEEQQQQQGSDGGKSKKSSTMTQENDEGKEEEEDSDKQQQASMWIITS